MQAIALTLVNEVHATFNVAETHEVPFHLQASFLLLIHYLNEDAAVHL
jgi:hypothetical protein